MRESLVRWILDADAIYHFEQLGAVPELEGRSEVQVRSQDYFIALLGELFASLASQDVSRADWARLGNAFAQLASGSAAVPLPGVRVSDLALYSAAAFYFGRYSASAYVVLKDRAQEWPGGSYRACLELLSRTESPHEQSVALAVAAVRSGELSRLDEYVRVAKRTAETARGEGPEQWVAARLFEELLRSFQQHNLRTVLPDGEDGLWDPLVGSLVDRSVWDFHPSQASAIRRGLLDRHPSVAIQMPTGSGKTALCEILLYHDVATGPGVAVLVVPYRALAAELRGTVAAHLRSMGYEARVFYGGTVAAPWEVRDLESTRVVIATPEALSGVLSGNPTLRDRVSLVVCDEGHLLEQRDRGVVLELLLSRFRGRASGAPRFAFVSAIIPNIEEINAWLGGNDDTVFRSTDRPVRADFAVLNVKGRGVKASVRLDVRRGQEDGQHFTIQEFLCREHFRYTSERTGKRRTHKFDSVRARAVGAARKALPMGLVAVFATNKRGSQGATGLAGEMLSQVENGVPLPHPLEFVSERHRVRDVEEYLGNEFGSDWIGTRALAVGAVLHHGDVPQECRELLEELLRDRCVGLVICTSTLAEGVNLPIRTLVLYSVRRLGPRGDRVELSLRDITNLVGRAGRAAASTRGLVICANENEWPLVRPAAVGESPRPVRGALIDLIGRLEKAIMQGLALDNELLETNVSLHPLTDGVDATLVDLASEEIGPEELADVARRLVDETYAASRGGASVVAALRNVLTLRAQAVAEIGAAGRLRWVRTAGASVRMVSTVDRSLKGRSDRWDAFETPRDGELVRLLVEWAWGLPEMASAVSGVLGTVELALDRFVDVVQGWIDGASAAEIASRSDLDVDTVLRIQTQPLSHALVGVVEQGVVILGHLLEDDGVAVSRAVRDFPDHLRFGVPTAIARRLRIEGLRHRRAAVALGEAPEFDEVSAADSAAVFAVARSIIGDRGRWLPALGTLVWNRTREDLAAHQ